jgi:hypothetical protein
MPLCATAVETDLLRIIHDLLGAYQPTTTAPLGQGQ